MIEPARNSCVCATLRMATRAVARIYDGALQPHGLRTTQYSVLARVEADGPSGVSQLARRLLMDRSTLTRELAPLEQRHLVSIAPGRDRRQRVVEITAAGRELLAEARPAWRDAQRAVRERFGDDRSRALVGELHELARLAAA